jgi:hypothetical protein
MRLAVHARDFRGVGDEDGRGMRMTVVICPEQGAAS